MDYTARGFRKGKAAISVDRTQFNGALQMLLRPCEIASKPACQSKGAKGAHIFRLRLSARDARHERCRVFSHRRKFTANVTADPQSIVNRISFCGVLDRAR